MFLFMHHLSCYCNYPCKDEAPIATKSSHPSPPPFATISTRPILNSRCNCKLRLQETNMWYCGAWKISGLDGGGGVAETAPLLTDAPGSVVLPTGANIKRELGHMIEQAEAGEVLAMHSGRMGLLRPAILISLLEQIGFSHNPKAIAYESILQHITSLTNTNKSDLGTHSLEFFGSDASLKYRLPPLEWDLFDSLKPDEGILQSGCQANETSADMNPNEGGGKAYEAFSNAVQIVLRQHSGQLSNKRLVKMAREVLQAQGFEQMLILLSCGSLDSRLSAIRGSRPCASSQIIDRP
ncbi:hypothetical protein DKX38_023551 [Salix brachista]|uniref:Uncharacterized protein n=1 Tax=Salix brachista TaxID=2182728 RepID=A0A5N5JK36_9ROSI|nr:hypothetical protein DKX38_023551 [Salix brachista]